MPNDVAVVKVRNITLHVQKNVTICLGNNTLALEISSLQMLDITVFNLTMLWLLISNKKRSLLLTYNHATYNSNCLLFLNIDHIQSTID